MAIPAEIRNPRTGQSMIFRKTAGETNGELLQVECYHQPGGPKEPVHTHPLQESRFEILSGRLAFDLAGTVRTAGAGEVVTIPAGARHCFWNGGDEVAHYLQEFRPALDSERFFRTLFQLAGEGRINERGMPSPLALAVLVPSMGNAIRPIRPPWPVLRGLAWLLTPLARLRGVAVPAPESERASTTGSDTNHHRTELEPLLARTRESFLALLDGVSDGDLRRPSGNPAWTIGAVLYHLVWSLEALPKEVARARRGKGMYNFPRIIRDPASAMIARRGARGQTVNGLRESYEAAYAAALRTLETLTDEDLSLGARFWGEGFFDIWSLYAAQADHLAEHGGHVREGLPQPTPAPRQENVPLSERR